MKKQKAFVKIVVYPFPTFIYVETPISYILVCRKIATRKHCGMWK